MSKDPAVLFYTSDFLTGTRFFTFEETGKYITLLCLQQQQGHLSREDITDLCGGWDEKVMRKFVQDEQGLYYNNRMEKEIRKRSDYTKSRKDNLNTGKNTPHMDNHMKSHMGAHMENEIDNNIYTNNSIGDKRGVGGEEPETPPSEPAKKPDEYKALFNYYKTLGLVKHRDITPEMRSAIDTAKRRGGYSWDELKTMLERHAYVVKLTAGTEYRVPMRGITTFFGQKVYQGTALICSEYADDGAKWLRYKDGLKEQGRAASPQNGKKEPQAWELLPWPAGIDKVNPYYAKNYMNLPMRKKLKDFYAAHGIDIERAKKEDYV